MGKRKKRKAGRPPKKHGKLDDRIIFALTPEQKLRYESAAEIEQLELSAWIRACLDKEADKSHRNQANKNDS